MIPSGPDIGAAGNSGLGLGNSNLGLGNSGSELGNPGSELDNSGSELDNPDKTRPPCRILSGSFCGAKIPVMPWNQRHPRRRPSGTGAVGNPGGGLGASGGIRRRGPFRY
jgi:hypothetical protein